MRFAFLLTLVASTFAADRAVIRMFDTKLTTAQRNDACSALRGDRSDDTLDAMRRALAIDPLRACAGINLHVAKASSRLLDALADANPEIRALAARELGALQNPELLPALAKAAQDPNLLVSTNAVQGLCQYEDRGVLPYLEAIARKGGILGILSLDRLAQLQDPAALAIARKLLNNPDAPDRVTAMRVIGERGDSTDLPPLRELAAKKEEMFVRQRGFGLMPPIDFSRAAQATIAQIEARLTN